MMLREGGDDGNPDGWPSPSSALWVVGSWWNVRHLENVKLVHYNDLKEDLAANMRDIAEFLEVPIREEHFAQMVQNCTFEAMKSKKNPMGKGGADVFSDPSKFFNKAQSKRWRDVLTDADTEEYREVASRYLDEEGIHWMETGKFE